MDSNAHGSKPVAELSDVEVLLDLAFSLESPRWFDTIDGDAYASEVRPRLVAIAEKLRDSGRELVDHAVPGTAADK